MGKRGTIESMKTLFVDFILKMIIPKTEQLNYLQEIVDNTLELLKTRDLGNGNMLGYIATLRFENLDDNMTEESFEDKMKFYTSQPGKKHKILNDELIKAVSFVVDKNYDMFFRSNIGQYANEWMSFYL